MNIQSPTPRKAELLYLNASLHVILWNKNICVYLYEPEFKLFIVQFYAYNDNNSYSNFVEKLSELSIKDKTSYEKYTTPAFYYFLFMAYDQCQCARCQYLFLPPTVFD